LIHPFLQRTDSFSAIPSIPIANGLRLLSRRFCSNTLRRPLRTYIALFLYPKRPGLLIRTYETKKHLYRLPLPPVLVGRKSHAKSHYILGYLLPRTMDRHTNVTLRQRTPILVTIPIHRHIPRLLKHSLKYITLGHPLPSLCVIRECLFPMHGWALKLRRTVGCALVPYLQEIAKRTYAPQSSTGFCLRSA
jgi:hypothetical protein